MDGLTIPARFNGPPSSGNGGYVGGSLARLLRLPVVDVSLRAPPPLDRELVVRPCGDAGLGLYDGELELARALPGELPDDVPAAPSLDAARAAGALARMTAAARNSPYAHCFGCGVARADGLRIQPGPVDSPDGVVATDWTPASEFADADGTVSVEAVWTALDCPAGLSWASRLRNAPPMLTARMTARIVAPLVPAEPVVVIGWPISQDGRKLVAGTAIFDAAGRLRAVSRQLCLTPRT